MSDTKKSSPLLTGIGAVLLAAVSAVFGALSPALKNVPYIRDVVTDRVELGWRHENSTRVLDETMSGGTTIEVGDVSTKRIYAHTVRIKNTGQVSLEKLELLLEISSDAGDLKLLSEPTFRPVSRNEFIDVKKVAATPSSTVSMNDAAQSISRRYNVSMLNEGSEVIAAILTTADAQVTVRSSYKGLRARSLDAIEAEEESPTSLVGYLVAALMAVGGLFSALMIAAISTARKAARRAREKAEAEEDSVPNENADETEPDSDQDA